jgi:hypothetical protein
MRRALGIALAMMCLFYAPASLCAQNAPINQNYQNTLILERIILFQHDLGKVQTLTAIPAGLNSQTAAVGYGQFLVPIDQSIYTLINNEKLFYQHWQDSKTQSTKTKQLTGFTVNRNVFNTLYNKSNVDEKKLIRLAWQKVFGVDVWYPYYKVKEIEDWVKEKVSVRVFGFKGKATIENKQILYVFKKTF